MTQASSMGPASSKIWQSMHQLQHMVECLQLPVPCSHLTSLVRPRQSPRLHLRLVVLQQLGSQQKLLGMLEMLASQASGSERGQCCQDLPKTSTLLSTVSRCGFCVEQCLQQSRENPCIFAALHLTSTIFAHTATDSVLSVLGQHTWVLQTCITQIWPTFLCTSCLR